jgi:hypothetical protein
MTIRPNEREGVTDPPRAKAPYSTPRLVVYGDLRVITQNMRRAGFDGGTGSNQFST